SQNMVKFQPVSRLNAILVVSKKPALLRTAATWIKRLDRVDSSRTSVHVYRVRYGDARQIARVLTDMFGKGSSSGNLLDSAENQIAPGSGAYGTASDRLSLNLNANSPSSSTGGFGSRSAGAGSGFGPSSASSGFGQAPGAAG